MATREEFLERVRREVRKSPGLFAATSASRPADARAAAAVLRREMAERWPRALDRFRAELEVVGGVFHSVATAAAAPPAIVAVARAHGARRAVAWAAADLGVAVLEPLRQAGLDAAAVPDQVGGESRRAHRAVAAAADLGVTGVDVALAETGTIVIASGPGRPRSTSLLPETHVAVFDRHCLVESLEHVGVVLEALHAATAEPGGAAINFITGPSRTADIELTLTRGVHGPKFVHAVFVEDDAGLGTRPAWGWP